MPKVTIVGAGHVGSTTALRLVEEDVADVAIIDIDADLAQGKALDMAQALFLTSSEAEVVGGSDYDLGQGSDVVVVTAGFPRKPGMSREDLLVQNAAVVKEVIDSLVEVAPGCVLIMVTKPLDEMTYLSWRITGWNRERILGMAGLLDSSRFAHFISRELGIPPGKVEPMVLGSHGDTMLPLARFSSVEGRPLVELLSSEKLQETQQKTSKGGAEIVALLKTGSAYYAPSACIAKMVRAVLEDGELQVPASVMLKGEYGLEDVFLGVPVILGEGGWKEVVELPLQPSEMEGLENCAQLIKERMAKLDEWLEGTY